MLVELRFLGVLVAVAIVAFVAYRLRRGKVGKTTFAIALLVSAALVAVAIEPGIVFAIRRLLGIEEAPLSGLVVALIVAVVVLFVLLVGVIGRADHTASRLGRLVGSLARGSLELPPGIERSDVAVVLPALDEAENLDVLLHRIPRRLADLDVLAIVVDDGSMDQTREIALRDGAAVISHPINQGGGAALRIGYDVAYRLGARIIVTMDADGQHDPAEMGRLLEPILADRADFVIGSRLMGEHEAASTIRHVGIYVFNVLISLLAGRKITDCSSGYRAMRADALRRVHLAEDQFHTSETILAAAKAGLRIEEVPVTISRRHSGVSKKPPALRYGWGFLRAIVKTWWR